MHCLAEVVLPKQSPVPDDLSKPFWDACNEDRLLIQNCVACDRMQFPPEQSCAKCGSSELHWREVSGNGRVNGYCVMHDSRVKLLQVDQPFNIAVIELEDDPDVKMFSHLPGTKPDEVTTGASVRVEFQITEATGQKVPEWRVV